MTRTIAMLMFTALVVLPQAVSTQGQPPGRQVSAGFGIAKRSLPVDSWTERLLDWMVARKLTTR